VLDPADKLGSIAAFEALDLALAQGSILNHLYALELFLTHGHHPSRVTKSGCSYGVTLSWSIYQNPWV